MTNPQAGLGADPVAVVGGGAGGLAVAVALARQGIPTRVFERSVNSKDIDRGDIIHFGSQRLLRKWGVWPDVQAMSPRPFTRFQILNGDGRLLLGLDTAQLLDSGVELNALRHADIVRALRSAAENSPLIELHDSEPVAELSCAAGRIDGVRTAKADYPAGLTVIAAGSKSKLRDGHFGKPLEYDYNRSFFNARVKALDSYRDGGYYVLDRQGLLIMATLPRDELRIGLQFVTSDRHDRPFANNFAEQACRIFRPLRHDSLTFIDGQVYRLHSLLARQWAVPGAVLLGDTAHTVHPTGGQGMNLAFGDADVLADALAAASSPSTLDDAANRYAAVRLAQVRPVHRRSHLGGLAAGITHPAAIAGRAGAVRLLNLITPVKRQIFQRVVDVR